MTMTHDDMTNDDDDGDHHTSIRQAVHDDVEETTMMTVIFFSEAVAKLQTSMQMASERKAAYVSFRVAHSLMVTTSSHTVRESRP